MDEYAVVFHLGIDEDESFRPWNDGTHSMIGKVLSLGHLSGTRFELSKAIQTCDPSTDNVGVLCIWFSSEWVGPNYTGYVIQANVTVHGLHPCTTNVCTSPPPSVDSNGRFYYHPSVIEQVCTLSSADQ